MSKRFGQAATPAEQALEQAIEKVDGWSELDIHYRPVSGGISNTNWKIDLPDGRSFFAKIPGRGTEMFVDRYAAHDASVTAGECGVSAKVHCFIESLGVEIFEFLDGYRASSNADFLEPTIRQNAALAFRHFHQQPALSLTKTIFDQADEHMAQVADLDGYTPPDSVWIRRQYEYARAALQAAGIDLAPCLNDNLAGNFMLNSDRDVLLVDFEYASNNDPLYDLALWFDEMFFEPEAEHEIIEAYFGEVTSQMLARIYIYRALADVKWSNWAWVQRQISTLAFDFHKYGVWKHLRARGLMQDARWVWALNHV